MESRGASPRTLRVSSASRSMLVSPPEAGSRSYWTPSKPTTVTNAAASSTRVSPTRGVLTLSPGVTRTTPRTVRSGDAVRSVDSSAIAWASSRSGSRPELSVLPQSTNAREISASVNSSASLLISSSECLSKTHVPPSQIALALWLNAEPSGEGDQRSYRNTSARNAPSSTRTITRSVRRNGRCGRAGDPLFFPDCFEFSSFITRPLYRVALGASMGNIGGWHMAPDRRSS